MNSNETIYTIVGKMTGTIKYYDQNASYYYDSTSQVDLVTLYKEAVVM